MMLQAFLSLEQWFSKCHLLFLDQQHQYHLGTSLKGKFLDLTPELLNQDI